MTQNLCCNGLVISADIVIPESQDPHPNFIQPIGPPLVIGDGVGIRVLAAIQLDGQPLTDTVEVEDVSSHWVLSAELEAGKGAVAQDRPQFGFGVGGRLAHLACETEKPVIVARR